MASVRKKPGSNFWYGCFTNADGIQKQRSTRLTNKGQALLMTNEWEQLFHARQVVNQARKVMADICAKAAPGSVLGVPAAQFFTTWCKNHEAELAVDSRKRYWTAVNRFIADLKSRGRMDVDIAEITRTELIEFRNRVAAQLGPGSANMDIVILRVGLTAAVREAHRPDNPAFKIVKLKKEDDRTQVRRPFSQTEIQKLMLHAVGEMVGMILFGLYTGQRLGELARLCWGDIELPGLTWRFVSKKTKRPTSIPLGKFLKGYLANLQPSGYHDPIFPEANAKYKASKNQSRRLSADFHKLMVQAGLVPKRSKANTGRGHSTSRKTNEITFHCLRHNATTWLKANNVPESVVRDIIGHESELTSRVYTHVEDTQKTAAIDKLDDHFDPFALVKAAAQIVPAADPS